MFNTEKEKRYTIFNRWRKIDAWNCSIWWESIETDCCCRVCVCLYRQCFTKFDIFSEKDWIKKDNGSNNNNNNSESQQMNATNIEYTFVVAFGVDELATIFFLLFLEKNTYIYAYVFILLRIVRYITCVHGSDWLSFRSKIKIYKYAKIGILYGHFEYGMCAISKTDERMPCVMCMPPKEKKKNHQIEGIWYWINIHWEFVEFMNLIEITSYVQYYL